ncbi:MAG TPA: DUF2254 domain-containing protein [Pyrinomonadaceae bacterium]|nr:DUF2254 domain-containing protein [Pyrinomonadaceae bacterium]
MSWLTRYHIRLYIRNSLWVLPALSIPLALITVSLLTRYEQAVGSQSHVSPETARTILSTIAASTFTLVALVASALLVTVQLASAQITPRIIGMVYRNAYLKWGLALFVFTFTFSIGVLVHIDETVPRVATVLAGYGFLLDLALFVFFIDGVGKALRPSSAVRAVALVGREVISHTYPSRLEQDSPAAAPIKTVSDEPSRTVLSEVDGAVLAFDLKGLVSLAERSNCLIELVPEVGQFIADGDPLFRIYQGGDRISDERLRDSVAVGLERTLDQDPMFAFRIIVDIASKALSPAINDPTTAVLAIDQIHHLLRDIGKRSLAEGREADRNGQIRLIYRTPNWEDFVQLGTTEIRLYGDDSIQVQRRLRAMLEDLMETLPERRARILHKELALLATSSKRAFLDLDDQELAESGDLQGIGGADDEIHDSDAPPASRN